MNKAAEAAKQRTAALEAAERQAVETGVTESKEAALVAEKTPGSPEENLKSEDLISEEPATKNKADTEEVDAVSTSTAAVAASTSKQDLLEWPDHDTYLLRLERILTDVHQEFFARKDAASESSSSSNCDEHQLPSLREVMPALRRKVLSGCVLVFSGVFPMNMPLQRSKAYQIATSLGAVVQSDLQSSVTAQKRRRCRKKVSKKGALSRQKRVKQDCSRDSDDELASASASASATVDSLSSTDDVIPGGDGAGSGGLTTHLVAARANTSKWHAARRIGAALVTPDWLWACHYHWQRMPEADYELTSRCSGSNAEEGSSSDPKQSAELRKIQLREERQYAKLRSEAKRAAREEERQLAAALPRPARFDLADHPLLRMSRDDLDDMEDEVNAADSDDDDDDDSSDSSKEERELRQAVLSHSPSPRSGSGDSAGGLAVDELLQRGVEDNVEEGASVTDEAYPKGWAPRRRRRNEDVDAAVAQQDPERDWGQGFAHEGYDYGDAERRFRALSDSASSSSGSDSDKADDVGDDTLDALRDFM